MFDFVKKIWRWIFGGKDTPVIRPDKPTVVSVTIEERAGKKYKITQFSDGTKKEEPYDEEDPSNIDDFLGRIGH